MKGDGSKQGRTQELSVGGIFVKKLEEFPKFRKNFQNLNKKFKIFRKNSKILEKKCPKIGKKLSTFRINFP